MPLMDLPGSRLLAATGPLRDWWSEHAASLITVPLRILLIVVIAVVLRYAVHKLVSRGLRYVIEKPPGRQLATRWTARKGTQAAQRIAAERRRQRAETLTSVLRSASTIIIFTIAAVIIIGELGVNLGPIIASIGVIGLAVGFGAQSLVSDVIAGIFMLAEDQYGVGDWVDVGTASGTVEEVGLRTTQLRDVDGVLWFIRNGQITAVGNSSQDWARAWLEIPVPYEADIDRVTQVLKDTAMALHDDPEYGHAILGEPEIWGIGSLTGDTVTIQLAVITAPSEQWGVARELRRRIKDAFDLHGLRVSLPQQTIWMRADGVAHTPEPTG